MSNSWPFLNISDMFKKKGLLDKIIFVFVLIIGLIFFSKIFGDWEHFKDGINSAI